MSSVVIVAVGYLGLVPTKSWTERTFLYDENNADVILQSSPSENNN